MKKELTREVLEAITGCDRLCNGCASKYLCDQGLFEVAKHLASALLEEMDKPKDDVWMFAPDGTTTAEVFYGNGQLVSGTPDYIFTRELPKTRARIMAEEIASANISNKKDLVDIIEQTINTHMKELKGEE